MLKRRTNSREKQPTPIFTCRFCGDCCDTCNTLVMSDEKKTPNIGDLKKLTTPKEPYVMPTLVEVFGEDLPALGKVESLNALLNIDPPKTWIKEHPFIKDHKYLPIDKVEYLLRKIFKRYKIELLREGTAFNGVYVVTRVWYRDPAEGIMTYHDGIGACQLQTAKGTSPADLANINNGAISMAFPIAKSLAVKDACDHLGNLFGANLNRKGVIPFQADTELIDKYKNALE